MRENKSMRSLLSWVFRLSVPLYFYIAFGKGLFSGVDLNSVHDVLVLAGATMSVLILIGGFFRKDTVTKVSAIVLVIISVIAVVRAFDLQYWFYPFFVSLYFWVYGNSY